MPGEFFFMAIGGLGVSLAGFAGLIAALDRSPGPASAVAAWRIRNIVLGGFLLTIAGFTTVAVYRVTDDVARTARISSAILALIQLGLLVRESRPGPAWPNEANRRIAIGFSALLIGATALDVALGRLGYLQVLFIAYLLNPMSIFLNTVRDVSGGEA